MSAYSGALEAIDRILNRGGDADEVLREVVAVLHDASRLLVGRDLVRRGGRARARPRAGEQTAEPTAIPISYENNVVAELGVVADELSTDERIFLERVALLISPYCLVGWDTGGEAWSP